MTFRLQPLVYLGEDYGDIVPGNIFFFGTIHFDKQYSGGRISPILHIYTIFLITFFKITLTNRLEFDQNH